MAFTLTCQKCQTSVTLKTADDLVSLTQGDSLPIQVELDDQSKDGYHITCRTCKNQVI